jgi:hypothetical protein
MPGIQVVFWNATDLDAVICSIVPFYVCYGDLPSLDDADGPIRSASKKRKSDKSLFPEQLSDLQRVQRSPF